MNSKRGGGDLELADHGAPGGGEIWGGVLLAVMSEDVRCVAGCAVPRAKSQITLLAYLSHTRILALSHSDKSKSYNVCEISLLMY